MYVGTAGSLAHGCQLVSSHFSLSNDKRLLVRLLLSSCVPRQASLRLSEVQAPKQELWLLLWSPVAACTVGHKLACLSQSRLTFAADGTLRSH